MHNKLEKFIDSDSKRKVKKKIVYVLSLYYYFGK